MPSKITSKKNGKFGGRPRVSSLEKIELSNAENVILTQIQYDKLLDKYGTELFEKALLVLDKWLTEGSDKAKKYIGKNHYAHFRSDGWLINNARYLMTKSHQTKL